MTIPAIIVGTANSLQPSGGGVQLCSREYQRLLRSAGLDLHLLSFEPDQRFFTRVLRRLEGRPYRRMVPPTLLGDLVRQVEKTSARFIFFNEIDFPSLLLPLRERFGKSVKLLHLSHGLDSTDICIAQQIERGRLGTERYNGGMVRRLGSKLQCEADYRRYLDGAICLSPLDAELERWLGARRTIWLSQPITEPPLDHKPVVGRVGCVATLDHVPNYDGLVEAFEALAKLKVSNLSFRLVGSPASRGAELGRRYNFVEYLGALSDAELRSEAASWSCFVHPIFHYARGRSTKLAVVLGWGLPLATTAAGARGYIWDESIFPLARTPPELAASVSEQLSLSEFERRREWTLQIAGIQPSSDVITQQAHAFLLALRSKDSQSGTI